MLADRPDDGRAAPAGELRGQRPDAAQHPVHQDRQAVDRPVGEDGPVGGDPRDPQAGADVIADAVGQADSLPGGNDRQLRRGAERPVGLGTEHPHALAGSARVDALACRLDHPGPVTVRDDPGERHLRPQPAAALLRVARVDPGAGDPDPDLTRARLSRGHLADLEHLAGRSLPFVPDCAHPNPLPVTRACGAIGDHNKRVCLTSR